MNQQRLSGLIAAPFTPMYEDGSINFDTIEKQAKLLTANGVSGAFICGTTGESLSLTVTGHGWKRMEICQRMH